MVVPFALDGHEEDHSIPQIVYRQAVFKEIGDLDRLIILFVILAVALVGHLGEEVGGVDGDQNYLAVHDQLLHLAGVLVCEPLAGDVMDAEGDAASLALSIDLPP